MANSSPKHKRTDSQVSYSSILFIAALDTEDGVVVNDGPIITVEKTAAALDSEEARHINELLDDTYCEVNTDYRYLIHHVYAFLI